MRENIDNTVSSTKKTKQELTSSLLQIKELREELNTITDDKERKELLNELFEQTRQLEKEVENIQEVKEDSQTSFEEEENSLKEYVQEYENSSRRMEEILEKEKHVFEANLTEEEINILKEYFANQKLAENKNSIQIKNYIEDRKKAASLLKTSPKKEEQPILEEEPVMENKEPENTPKVSLLDQIESLYSIHNTFLADRLKHRVLLIESPMLNNMIQNADKLPQRIVGNAKAYTYTPDKAPKDLENVDINYNREEIFAGSYLHDDDNMSEVQQKQKVFDMMKASGIEVDQESGFEISYSGEDSNQNVNFKVYRKIMPEKEQEVEEKVEVREETPIEKTEVKDTITFFYDKEHDNDIYVKDFIAKRFHFAVISDLVEIEGSACYRISKEDAEYIIKNQDNDYSPYTIEKKEVSVTKEDKEEVVPIKNTVKKSILSLYYEEMDDDRKVYAEISTLRRFGIFPNNEYVLIDKVPYYRIRQEDENKIKKFIEKSTDMELEYNSLPKKKELEAQEDLSYDTIIQKLTVEVPTKEKYKAKDLDASRAFFEDLKKEKVMYNIIYSVSADCKASSKLIKHLTKNFDKSPLMKEYENRLHNLTEKELNVLLHEYKDSSSIQQMNLKMKEYIKGYLSDDLEIYESSIKANYDTLFHLIGKVKALEEALVFSELEKGSKDALIRERRTLIEQSSGVIKNILENRKKVSSILGKKTSLNISELKEKYPYITLRYEKLDKKKEDYANDFQEKLEKAMKEENNEAIVSNFINLESCYYNDQNNAASLTEGHSIGVKYYNILTKQFGYRSDDFIQQLFTIIACYSAEIHDVCNQRIQDIEAYSLLQSLPAEINWEFDDAIFKENMQQLDEKLIEYENNKMNREDIITYLDRYENESQRNLISTVNEIITSLKETTDKNSEYDLVTIQEKLETIIVHPESICTRNLENNDVMLGTLRSLPKQMLITLILAASNARYASEVNHNMTIDNTVKQNGGK